MSSGPRVEPPSTHRVDLVVGTAVGGISALLGLVLGWLFLALAVGGDVGTARPFAELTTDGVSPFAAATWTYFDALGAAPVVTWDEVLVRRGVLDVLDGAADNYALLRVLPPALLAVAGGVAVTLADRLRGDGEARSPGAVTPEIGSYVALGYTPVLLLALWVATVPAAPGASGTVEIGGTLADAVALQGATAGPPPVPAVVAAVGFPLVFGLAGGVLATRLGGGS